MPDRRVTLGAKVVVFLTLAYALSPIDLIPDFIPVLGMLDDLVLVPLGLMLAMRLIPADLQQELRALAVKLPGSIRVLRNAGLALVLLTWGIVIVLLLRWAMA